MKTSLLRYAAAFLMLMSPGAIFAQSILYSPNTYTYTVGVDQNIAITPAISGNAALNFGTGVQLTVPGTAPLNNPWGLGINPVTNNVYVTNYGASAKDLGSITYFNSSGTYQGTFVDATYILNPQGIAFDQSGNAYVLNYQRSNNGNGNQHGNAMITAFNSSFTFSSYIAQNLITADGMTNDQSNNIYVAQGSYNSGNQVITEFNSSGSQLSNISGTNPVGVAVDASGNIYMLDNTTKSVYEYTSTGTLLNTFTTSLTNPYGLAVDAGGDIFIGDSGSGAGLGTSATTAGQGKVVVYNSSGTLLLTLPGYTDPRGLIVDGTGNFYVSDYSNNTITRYPATGGFFIDKPLPPGLNFNSATGEFTGTPTAAYGPVTYTVTGHNGTTTFSNTVTIRCNQNPNAPAFYYNPAINIFTIGAVASVPTPTITNGAPIKYVISPALPTGLTFNQTTGAITGSNTGNTTPTGMTPFAARTYTVTGTDASNLSGSTTISIACVLDNFWTGSKNSDWNTKQNWNAGHVPVSTDIATIGVHKYTGPNPVVTYTTTVPITYVNYVEFGNQQITPVTLTVQNTANFTVQGRLIIDDNASPTFQGSGGGGNVNISSGATIKVNAGTLNVDNNTLTAFTLRSNASGSAAVDQIETGGQILGQVKVERYLAANRFYRLLTSPVNSGTTTSTGVWSLNYFQNSMLITGTNPSGGFDKVVTTSGPTLYLYKENFAGVYGSFLTTNWRDITNLNNGTGTAPYYAVDGETNPISLTPGTGVLVFFRGDRSQNPLPPITPNQYTVGYPGSSVTLTATGMLNQGAITYKDPFTGLSTLSFNSGSANPGFNLVANPYACTINVAPMYQRFIAAGINPTVYELDVTSTKNYVYYDTDPIFSGFSSGSQYIVSGQGFFVVATGTGQTMTFQETDKAASIQLTNNALFMAKSPVATQKAQYLCLYVAKDSVTKTQIGIGFKPTATAAYDPMEDAPFISGDITFYSLSSDNKQLMVNKLPLDQKETKIHLYVSGVGGTPYTLNVKSLVGIPQIYDVWLMDAFKKDSVDLRANKSYAFTTSAAPADTLSWGGHRFTIVIRQNPAKAYKLLTFSATKESAPGKSKGNVLLTWTTQNEQNYTHFTVERSNDGGKTFNVVGGLASTGAGQYSLEDKNPLTGDNLYRVKSEDFNGAVSYSMVLTIQYHGDGADDNNVTVYPNPVKNNLNLDVKVQQGNKSRYDVRITNNFGLVVKQVLGTDANWQTNVAELLPGTYIVQVLNHDDHSFVGRTKFVKL